jgi:hypothetical protein
MSQIAVRLLILGVKKFPRQIVNIIVAFGDRRIVTAPIVVVLDQTKKSGSVADSVRPVGS